MPRTVQERNVLIMNYSLSSVNGFCRRMEADNIESAEKEAIEYKSNTGYDCSVLTEELRPVIKVSRNVGKIVTKKLF